MRDLIPLNLSHPRVPQMVTDSLRYWITEMHVDGFRFDFGDHSRTRRRRFRPGRWLSGQLPVGPVAEPGETHRRTMGLRTGRVPGGVFSARLGGVEPTASATYSKQRAKRRAGKLEAWTRRVRSNGEIKCAGELVYISESLIGEIVGVLENENGDWLVRFANLGLGTIARQRQTCPLCDSPKPQNVSPILPV
jgi:hypothetical protein